MPNSLRRILLEALRCCTESLKAWRFQVVRGMRLELTRLAALEPKSSASTNSATPASWVCQSGAHYTQPRCCRMAWCHRSAESGGADAFRSILRMTSLTSKE
ncbi:protein of unknown function [Thauera humireducens]|nr:protein of unknown function [Thauera humireducens]